MIASADAGEQRAQLWRAVRQASSNGICLRAVGGKRGAAFVQAEQGGVGVFALHRVFARRFAEGGAVGGGVQYVVGDLVGDAEVFAECVQRRRVCGVVGSGLRAKVQCGAYQRAGFAAVHGLQLRQCERAPGRRHVAHLSAYHPRPSGGSGKGLDLCQLNRRRERAARQQGEGEGVQRVAGEDSGRFVIGAVRAGASPAQVVIVHRGQIVVDERVGVDGFHCAGGGVNGVKRHGEGVSRGVEERGAQAFAAAEGGVAHRIGKAFARRWQHLRQHGFDAGLAGGEVVGHGRLRRDWSSDGITSGMTKNGTRYRCRWLLPQRGAYFFASLASAGLASVGLAAAWASAALASALAVSPFTLSSSTSKVRVAFGGMLGGAPVSP